MALTFMGGGVRPLTAYRSTDATARSNTNTISSAADDDVLTVPVEANGVYIAEGMIVYSTTDVADLRIAWGTPAGATVVHTANGPAGNATSSAAVSMRVSSDGTFAIIGGMAGGTDMVASPLALIRISSTGGSVAFRWAQNTAEVSNTILRAGSWIRLTKVG